MQDYVSLLHKNRWRGLKPEVYISCIIIASNVCFIQLICCCVWIMSLSHTVRLPKSLQSVEDHDITCYRTQSPLCQFLNFERVDFTSSSSTECFIHVYKMAGSTGVNLKSIFIFCALFYECKLKILYFSKILQANMQLKVQYS